MSDTEVRLSDDEWLQVLKRLTFAARKLVPPGRPMPGVARSAEDLVQETFRKFWDRKAAVWDHKTYGAPTVDGVVGYLFIALKRVFLDSLKRADFKHAAPDDDQDRGVLQPGLDPTRSERATIAHLYVRQLYERARKLAEVDGDVDVVLFLDLQVGQGGPYANREAAQELGITAADVVNIRKRLDRFLVTAKSMQATARRAGS